MYTNSDEQAQKIMCNVVIVIPSQEFERPSRWYYRVQEVKKCELRVVTHWTTSIPNFMKIFAATV
jgi:hypothetical protein